MKKFGITLLLIGLLLGCVEKNYSTTNEIIPSSKDNYIPNYTQYLDSLTNDNAGSGLPIFIEYGGTELIDFKNKGDVYFLRFVGESGDQVVIKAEEQNESGADPVVALLDHQFRNQIFSMDYDDNGKAEISFTLNTDGTYYIAADTYRAEGLGEVLITLNCANCGDIPDPVNSCPRAYISGDSYYEVNIATNLCFSGSGSDLEDGEISNFEWKVISQPEGSTAYFEDPILETGCLDFLVIGNYVIGLTTYDSEGLRSCEDATVAVSVKSEDKDLRVELTWTTPDDELVDDCEGCGSDVDLHLLHPNSEEVFNKPYDCFFDNMNPSWGNENTNNPSLDIDDVNGWGPENIGVILPESGINYTVGIHYWDDHGYGTSLATVRVYWNGELIFESYVKELVMNDYWVVGTINSQGGFNLIDTLESDVKWDNFSGGDIDIDDIIDDFPFPLPN